MKKLLSLSLASLAFAAVADYQPIQVEVTTIVPTADNTIIPVPVTKIGTADAISVHDLVKAANLPENTMLYYFDGTNYKAWKQNGGEWTTPDITATIGSASVTAGSNEINVSVGAALWVVFPSGTKLSEQKIVVYGSPVATKTSTIASGKINLLSNPTAGQVSGEVLATRLASIAKPGDKILPIGDTFTGNYTMIGGVWKQNNGAGYTEQQLPNLNGYQGFWYISKTGAGTLNW